MTDELKTLILEMSKEEIIDMYEQEIDEMILVINRLSRQINLLLDGIKSIRDAGLGNNSRNMASRILENFEEVANEED